MTQVYNSDNEEIKDVFNNAKKKLFTSEKQLFLEENKSSNLMDRVIRSYSGLCFQVMGKDTTGRTAWYFVLVDQAKRKDFLDRKPGDNYDLADYGSIIASGYGETIPEDIKTQLREKYGFDNF